MVCWQYDMENGKIISESVDDVLEVIESFSLKTGYLPLKLQFTCALHLKCSNHKMTASHFKTLNIDGGAEVVAFQTKFTHEFLC